MFTKLKTATIHGLDVVEIICEVDIGGPGKTEIQIVGLGDTAVQEAIARIQRALYNCGYPIPNRRFVINLAPADIKKTGTLFDLPIALGILYSNNDIKNNIDDLSLFLGELALDGMLRPINGTLPISIFAKEKGYKNLYIPAENAKEASLIKGINIYPVKSIKQLIDHLNGIKSIDIFNENIDLNTNDNKQIDIDFSDIKGQYIAKRAFVISASGHHNILLVGAPGAGKTLLTKAMVSIMSDMTENEIIEVTKLYSIAGLTNNKKPLINTRPFRVVHHTASNVSIVGGGRIPRPGEITLAHRGVLFLDEIAEFQTNVLEVLRQPMEDRKITINRATGSITYPAHFILVGAMNPCPCGYYNVPNAKKQCTCTLSMIQKYNKKISGPLLDRFDLYVNISPVEYDNINTNKDQETSIQIKEKVQKAKDIQRERFKNTNITSNSEMGIKEIEKYCILDNDSQKLVKIAMDKFNMSMRGYHRLLKVARTIADLSLSEKIEIQHITEALQYRKSE